MTAPPWEPEGERFAGAFGRARDEAAVWLDDASRAAGVELEAPARAALLTWLVRRWCACAHTALETERRRAGVAPEELAASVAEPAARRRFLGDYPVVERLLTVSGEAWRRRTGRLFDHLVRDAAELGVERPVLRDVGSHSERLQGRRTTMTLTLPGGRRWVYREKNLALAAWFMEVCAALNAGGLSLPLHVRPILVREGCSWDAFVPSGPCRDDGEVHRFFVRAGLLLRLLERLAAVDFHVENILPAGEHPVLADIETLFAPWPEQAPPEVWALIRSPLPSALLSIVMFGEPGRAAIQGGGLHEGGEVVVPFRMPRLRAEGDAREGMEEIFEADRIPRTIPAPLGEHVDAIIAGYEEMEEVLARAPDLHGLLAAARGLPVRDMRTSGELYQVIQFGSLDPALLRSEAARDAWLALQPVGDDERVVLRDLENPRPAATVGAHPALAPAPPSSPAERARRIDIIRTLVALRDDRPPAPRGAAPAAPPASMTATAVELGDRILALAFQGPRWHVVLWLPWSGNRVLDVLGDDLLSGHAGLALAVAALFRATGLARFRDAALATLDRVPAPGPVRWPGGLCGLGGAIYALARCAEWLALPSLAQQAVTYLRTAPRRPLQTGPWDVVTGVAGLLLGARPLLPVWPEAIAALRGAVARGLDAPPHVPGGMPACLPDVATGVAVALLRCGHAVAIDTPRDAPLAWRLELDPTAAHEATQRLALPGDEDPLGDVDLALAVHRVTGDPELLEIARLRAAALCDRWRRTGRWFPETSVAERHQLSAITGLPAIILALLSVEARGSLPSIRRME